MMTEYRLFAESDVGIACVEMVARWIERRSRRKRGTGEVKSEREKDRNVGGRGEREG